MLKKIEEILEPNLHSIAIAGHTRPDGDCAGSCLGLMHYLRDLDPNLEVKVFLEKMLPKFEIMPGFAEAEQTAVPEKTDLLIVLDCADKQRIGAGHELTEYAEKVICIDHHISNQGFADLNHICPDSSSTSEVLYDLMDPDRISYECAFCLYTGLVHDTGVFRHSCTSENTMKAAGVLIGKGVPFTRIIQETFYQKTFAENKAMGQVLQEAELHFDGQVISGIARRELMEKYHLEPKNMDGVVDQLNLTEGVKCTVFLYETDQNVFKASLRSNSDISVSEIALKYGGGGHVKAAGCTIAGTAEEVLSGILNTLQPYLAI